MRRTTAGLLIIHFEWWRREKAPRSGGGYEEVACTSGAAQEPTKVEKGPEAHAEPTRREGGLEENCKMGFLRKKLTARRS